MINPSTFTATRGAKLRLLAIGAVLVLALLSASYALLHAGQKVAAVTGSDWNAGYIIDDTVFYNQNSTNPVDIQTFLNSQVPSCDTNGTQPATEYGRSDLTHAQYAATRGWSGPPYTCLKDYKQDVPQTEAASGYCGAIPAASAVPASQIIYEVGQACHVNPQALIVLLQKEQSLVLDTWPLSTQYRTATGYGCPDTAACDTQYYGFFNQVYSAAKQFQIYKAFPNDYSYVAGRNNNIYYNPDHSCGSSTVYIQNQATAGLYIYTPYQPNQAALNNLYGSGDGCSSYGNRNFWRLFNDWFGTTQAHAIGTHAATVYKSSYGYATTEEICGLANNGCYQIFQNGVSIYWSSGTGAHVIAGGIRAKWSASGSENSTLGYPASDELYGNKDGGAYQVFQNGRIYYLNNGQSYIILNSIYTKWTQLGTEWSYLGYPVMDTVCGLRDAGCYQIFSDGSVIYADQSAGTHTIAGGIRAKWAAGGSEWNVLGYPTSDEQYSPTGAYQTFQNGKIHYDNASGHAYALQTNIDDKWTQLGANTSTLGYPVTDSLCGLKLNGCYQIFQNGITIYWSSATGAHTMNSAIHAKWGSVGSENSQLGYPTSDELYANGTAYQQFQGGTITWYFNGSPTTITYN